MAKGDKNKVEKAIEAQQRVGTSNLERMRPIMQEQSDFSRGLRGMGTGQNMADYEDIMGMYRNAASGMDPSGRFSSRISAPNVNYSRNPELARALAGYGEFADTGGYSEADLANMRARGASPIRSVYANAQTQLDRAKRLQGGYSPNTAAATAKMARELSSTLSDKSQELEGSLAEMKQRGRLAGLGGLSQNAIADLEMGLRAQMANQQANMEAERFNAGQGLEALRGMTSLYGTTPAMAALFGNQAMQNQNQEMELEDMFNRFGQAGVSNRIASSQLPSTAELWGNRIRQYGPLVAGAAGSLMGSGGRRRPTYMPENYEGGT